MRKAIDKIIIILFGLTIFYIIFKYMLDIDIWQYFFKPVIIEVWKQIKNIF